jgi:hypothetical protein
MARHEEKKYLYIRMIARDSLFAYSASGVSMAVFYSPDDKHCRII